MKASGFATAVAEAPKPSPADRAWPRGIPIVALSIFIFFQMAWWGLGFVFLFLNELVLAGWFLTLALVLFLVFSWAWRWAVAAGYIGGRPTPRFGGA